MSKTIKIIYYVHPFDNTKGALIAFPSDKNLREAKVINELANALWEGNFGDMTDSKVIAWEIAHNGSAKTFCKMGEYEFGIEETELYE